MSVESQLLEKDNEIKIITKKLHLESKRCKYQLQLEQQKTKEVMMKLEKARTELMGFRKIEEIQVKIEKHGI